ncbi:hypothetical protein PILCRDRAFT_559034 [Piloderma croceum F 1598]|uniref:Uncharacterized protein n=1 Tax=Piloderma croceum (strain F 1598) TaxID=765440 RepID=A0A0C3F433_PILCF|nr:hypothetical protein PILCRDRAFT_559034 [Piloderma croceum F 1598]
MSYVYLTEVEIRYIPDNDNIFLDNVRLFVAQGNHAKRELLAKESTRTSWRMEENIEIISSPQLPRARFH